MNSVRGDDTDDSLSATGTAIGIAPLNGGFVTDMAGPAAVSSSPPPSPSKAAPSLLLEAWTSAELVFGTRLIWLLAAAPPALVGSSTGWLSESTCFALAGMALIPCAERLSFITEHAAAHTNGTVGALLNATFGNAPEFLISSAALRAGFYRVVQLALLGSVLTNLLMVFGMSCLIGGLRWQVQELRVVSGNVAIGMLFLGTAGTVLTATLVMTGQVSADGLGEDADTVPKDKWEASEDELRLSRFNSVVMMTLYVLYLFFQLGTHTEEFSDTVEQNDAYKERVGSGSGAGPEPWGWRKRRARRNLFCRRGLRYPRRIGRVVKDRFWYTPLSTDLSAHDLEMGRIKKTRSKDVPCKGGDFSSSSAHSSKKDGSLLADDSTLSHRGPKVLTPMCHPQDRSALPRQPPIQNRGHSPRSHSEKDLTSSTIGGFSLDDDSFPESRERRSLLRASKNSKSDPDFSSSSEGSMGLYSDSLEEDDDSHHTGLERVMTFRCSIAWMLIVTVCISVLSDILVDTIDGFALRYHISEVFTSVIILPIFSNIAEQVSAIIFAHRNEMDLCIGVTIGSAVQIANFVIPGCVLVGWAADRSLSLYFRGYETCCLLVSVLCVSAVLQGGTTNWLVGAFFLGVYFMIAAGFWFHEVEDLSIDAEEEFRNATAIHMAFVGKGVRA